jgi:hypothetical protein
VRFFLIHKDEGKMGHDCRMGYLETIEDQEGYLYLKWTTAFAITTERFEIEFCPICGEKAKKSIVENLIMFPRDDVAEDQLQKMHKIIMKIFLNSCEILVKEDLDDHSFRFCLDTIQDTLRYVGAKRNKDHI